MKELTKKGFAEFLGTFVLVFLACGTAIVTRGNVVATAFSFGLVIIAMSYSIGHISGCHVNPAVSIALFLSNKMSTKELIVYIFAQFIGAIMGATILFTILVGAGFELGVTHSFAANSIPYDDIGGYFAAIASEIVLTFIFIYVVLSVISKKENSKFAGIIIGLTLTLVHLLGIGITGTSVNPARSAGPALMSLAFGGDIEAIKIIWIFFLAPLFGSLSAALAFQSFNKKEEE